MMSQSPECVAIEKCSSVAVELLSSGVVSLDRFGQSLVSTGFMTNTALRNILDTPGVHGDRKARQLIDIVYTQVKINSEKFYKQFISILKEAEPLESLLVNIQQVYTTEKQQAAEKNTREPKRDFLIIESSITGFLCPCGGRCTLSMFLTGECPKKDKYPFLKKESLSQNERETLEIRLHKEATDMSTQFEILIKETFDWLDSSTTQPKRLKSIVLGHIDLPKDELRNANTFDDIIEVLGKKWSWFHYSLLKKIINVCCHGHPDALPMQQLQLYEDEFRKYCNRRVFECRLPIEEYSSGDPVLVMKFVIDACHLQLLKLNEVKLEISYILNAERELKLLTIADGCTKLFFSLPKSIASKVFPLNSEQEELLAKIGILKCYLYENEGRSIKFLVCGKTGVGKSTLINSLIGKEIFEVGVPADNNLGPTTKEVEDFVWNKLKISIYDSPGLQDANDKNRIYVEAMYEKCRGVDLFLYCIDMSSSRTLESDEITLKHIHGAFGKNFWKRCVCVLTKANGIDPEGGLAAKRQQGQREYHQEFYTKHLQAFRKLLKRVGVPDDTVSALLACAAGRCYDNKEDRYIWYASDKTKYPESPNDKVDFLKELLNVCNEAMSRAVSGSGEMKESQEKFRMFTNLRMKLADLEKTKKECEDIKAPLKSRFKTETAEREKREKQQKKASTGVIVGSMTAVGGLVGAIGGPPGAIIGAAVGSAVGGVLGYFTR